MTYGNLRKLNNYLYITDTPIDEGKFYVKATMEKLINIETGEICEEKRVIKNNHSYGANYSDEITVLDLTGFVISFAPIDNNEDDKVMRLYNHIGNLICTRNIKVEYGKIYQLQIGDSKIVTLICEHPHRSTAVVYDMEFNKLDTIYDNIPEIIKDCDNFGIDITKPSDRGKGQEILWAKTIRTKFV